MPKADGEKTKSARKLLLPILVFVGVVIVVAVCVAMFLPKHQPAEPIAKINGHLLTLELATTFAAQEKGLSGRQSLDKSKGMLFVFPDEMTHCFWMKDMRFNIDMIWLDNDQRIVHVERNASPKSYPNQFCPEKASTYVLEVTAGRAAEMGVKVGQTVELKLR